MKRKKIFKRIIYTILIGLLITGGIVIYLFNMPHRDIQNSTTDYKVSASVLVEEYLINAKKADKKYLDEEGESKIFEVEGIVKEITEDFNAQKVVLLQNEKDRAGVSCTFTKVTNKEVSTLKIGQKIKIKGVIRSGASYDSDLGMYENVIIEKSSLVK